MAGACGGHFGCKWLRGNGGAGLPAPPCRFAPYFAGLPWTTQESISDSNCSTLFITSFNHHHHHRPRGECRFQRERSSVVIGSLSAESTIAKKAQRRKPTKAFGFSSRQKRRELFHASQFQIPRSALPYSSCLVLCYLVVPTSSSLGLREG